MIKVRNRVYSKSFGYGTVVAYADESFLGRTKFLVRFDYANSFLDRMEDDLKELKKSKADMLDKEWLKNHCMLAYECDGTIPPIGLFVIKCNGSGSIKFNIPYVPFMKGYYDSDSYNPYGLDFNQKDTVLVSNEKPVGAGDVVKTYEGYGVCLGYSPSTKTVLVKYFDTENKSYLHSGLTVYPVEKKDYEYVKNSCLFVPLDCVSLVRSYHTLFLNRLEEVERKKEVVTKAIDASHKKIEGLTFIDKTTGKRYKLVEI